MTNGGQPPTSPKGDSPATGKPETKSPKAADKSAAAGK